MSTIFLATLYSIAACLSQDYLSKAQTSFSPAGDSSAYIKKCIAFIEEVEHRKLSDTNFILSDKPATLEHLHCLDQVILDSNFLSKDEIAIIKDKKYPTVVKWTKQFFPNIKIISSDSIAASFKNLLTRWGNFNQKFGASYNTFSSPIFLKNDNYCLFYSDHSCGELCGEGTLALYKKEEGKWIKVITYCYWIS